ncbi:hydantoinase B/oxoprolinase family protein [Pararoseomonas indoligenes]|uniref:Hydantoinase B/oxoprolinase family protein n=1 Tax=Roseomonas indoligenes TaxID=2820811 RepID=A0A940MXZ6_9PROT|nr:hydantoinase B/oxoprolinase family protein [Pararoseomonas indoligenes]MBP0496353.1 hydantoinase B/oxoprolinase family protein [Pararoseomonas indoligenes]
MSRTLNPVDQAVISQSLLSAAREMGIALYRSAYSSVVRDGKDASTGILDPQGNAVAQSDELIPILVGSLSITFRACAARFPVERLKEGDFYICNHPYHGAHHLQDILIFVPIFYEGRIVGFSAAVAHHLDIGGGAPGINAASTDFYQEGLVIPPSRYNLDEDWNNDGPLRHFIGANIRVPEQTLGDIDSQFAACAVGAARVREMCAKYSAETVGAAMEEMISYVERRVRAAIAAMPDGIYVGEDAVDDDGRSDTPLPIRVTVTVRGDSMVVDFAGTCPQVPTQMNAPYASTVSATLACIKAALTGEDVPFNEGASRAVTIEVPRGSLLNPNPPAPVRSRMEASYRAYDAVLKALGQAMPDRAVACGYDTTTGFCLTHLKDGRYRVFIELRDGGYGASAQGDGSDAVAGPLSNCTNTPVEQIDADFDFFRIEHYALRPGSGGKGRFRGGLGSSRAYRITEDGVRLAIYADRFRFPAGGLKGGGAGATGYCAVHRDGAVIEVRSKDDVPLRKGDLIVHASGGGGGHGDPAARDPAAIGADREQGYVAG